MKLIREIIYKTTKTVHYKVFDKTQSDTYFFHAWSLINNVTLKINRWVWSKWINCYNCI